MFYTEDNNTGMSALYYIYLCIINRAKTMDKEKFKLTITNS